MDTMYTCTHTHLPGDSLPIEVEWQFLLLSLLVFDIHFLMFVLVS